MRSLPRRRALAILTALAAACAVQTTTASAAPALPHPATAATTDSTIGGPITASEVMARARDWWTRSPNYDETRKTLVTDVEGAHRYGADCSGMVAMALHLPTNSVGGPNTGSLPNYGNLISTDDLQPGDFLNDTVGNEHHAVLFEAWAPDHKHFSYWSFGSTPMIHYNGGSGVHEGPLASFAEGVNIASHPSLHYRAYHYPNLVRNGGRDGFGYYNPGDGSFHLNDAINGQAGTSYAWDTGFETVANVKVLVGDWNGDGRDSVGYYNPGDGTFHLNDAINGQTGTSYAWDTGFETVANVQVLVGDWNGDGRDSVGYYNPGDGTFHLNDAINGQTGTSYAWDTGFETVPNVQILTGDWNGQ
jgi:hypothetical protein